MAGVGIETTTTAPKVGEATITQDIFISAPRITHRYIHKGSLASKGVNGYVELLAIYDWDISTMSFILTCESGGNKKAIGDRDTAYQSYGLLQIRNLPDRNLSIEELFIPERNIEIGYQIFKKQGYNAWYNCYMMYLSQLR